MTTATGLAALSTAGSAALALYAPNAIVVAFVFVLAVISVLASYLHREARDRRDHGLLRYMLNKPGVTPAQFEQIAGYLKTRGKSPP